MGTIALGMMSGGLDSILAARLLLEQGVDVRLLHLRIPFHGGKGGNPAEDAARQLGLDLIQRDVGEDFLDMLKHPRHGTGKGLNPCIDCRIHQLHMAREAAEDIGASFIFTGEVLGQRPMSQQRRAMRTVAAGSDLRGKLLRPLSAKLLQPTEAEEAGWVDRERLLDLSGRTRKPQIALAEQWGITDYPGPAGGCLLTDKGFSRRLADLFEHHPDCTLADVEPLKVGRHFRTPGGAKLVVGRNNGENHRIRDLAVAGLRVYMEQLPGPVVLVQDSPPGEAAALGGDAAFAHSSTDHSGELDLRVLGGAGQGERVSHTPSAGRHELRNRLGEWRI